MNPSYATFVILLAFMIVPFVASQNETKPSCLVQMRPCICPFIADETENCTKELQAGFKKCYNENRECRNKENSTVSECGDITKTCQQGVFENPDTICTKDNIDGKKKCGDDFSTCYQDCQKTNEDCTAGCKSIEGFMDKLRCVAKCTGGLNTCGGSVTVSLFKKNKCPKQ